MSPKGIALLKRYEGCKLRSYLCPAGKWTIGYGSTGPHVKPNMVINQADAEALLLKDLVRFETAVLDALVMEPLQLEFDAMVSLAYNIGIANFNKSSIVRKYNAGDKTGAANAFGMWNKAKVNGKLTVLNGLVARRAAEKTLFLAATPPVTLLRPQSLQTEATTSMLQSSLVPEAPKPLSRSREIIIGGGLSLGGVSQFIDTVSVNDLSSAQSTLTEAKGYLETPVAKNMHLPEVAGLLLAAIGCFMIWKRYKDRKDGIR